MAFNHLLKFNRAEAEYQVWVDNAPTHSPAYHQLVGVNLDDPDQIFPALRFSKATADYFLSHIGFPTEMKEFPDKLSASGWDTGEIKSCPTVGFRGTNDSRQTLPLSVRQLDLPEVSATTRKLLACIPHPCDPCTSDAQTLLDLVLYFEPPAQVIFDVGARILELSNHDMAKAWLRRNPAGGRTQAIVFVNDRDEICALDRNGRVDSLQTSPFAQHMDACFVFLHEHT
jgi:hypothetical protein